jgi:tetratricopeptide (TPR) repeat protein
MERAEGKESAGLLNGLTELADDLATLGRHREALAATERAIAIGKKHYGAHAPQLALPLVVAGEQHLALGDARGAVPLLEESLKMQEASSPLALNLGETRFALARALAATGGGPRVHGLAQAAAADYEKGGAPGEAEKVRAWLHARAK